MQTIKNPTQADRVSLARCDHGYYVHAEKLRTPRCPCCHQHTKKNNLTHFLRTRLGNGRFAPIHSVAPGVYRCTICREIKPLSEFYGATSRATGKQSRCKKCDNRLKNRRIAGR
jgi:hypothetical protein